MACWWVNQTESYEAQHDGQYIWAPARQKDGRRNGYHERLRALARGDLVVHTDGKAIRAVSQVVSPAVDAARPRDLGERPWGSDDGRLVRVSAHREVLPPRALDTIPPGWRQAELDGPFTRLGGLKSGHLSPVSRRFLELLQLPDSTAVPTSH